MPETATPDNISDEKKSNDLYKEMVEPLLQIDFDSLPYETKELFSKIDITDKLVKFIEISGKNKTGLFLQGFPALINSLGIGFVVSKCPQLIEVGLDAGETVFDLFKSGFPSLAKSTSIDFINDNWSVLTDIVKNSNTMAWAIFQHVIPSWKENFGDEYLNANLHRLASPGLITQDNIGKIEDEGLPEIVDYKPETINNNEETTNAVELETILKEEQQQVPDKQVTDKQVPDKQVTDKQVIDKQVTDKLVANKQDKIETQIENVKNRDISNTGNTELVDESQIVAVVEKKKDGDKNAKPEIDNVAKKNKTRASSLEVCDNEENNIEESDITTKGNGVSLSNDYKPQLSMTRSLRDGIRKDLNNMKETIKKILDLESDCFYMQSEYQSIKIDSDSTNDKIKDLIKERDNVISLLLNLQEKTDHLARVEEQLIEMTARENKSEDELNSLLTKLKVLINEHDHESTSDKILHFVENNKKEHDTPPPPIELQMKETVVNISSVPDTDISDEEKADQKRNAITLLREDLLKAQTANKKLRGELRKSCSTFEVNDY